MEKLLLDLEECSSDTDSTKELPKKRSAPSGEDTPAVKRKAAKKSQVKLIFVHIDIYNY